MTALFGLVLAGGQSTRFGREKAIAMFQGRSLLDIAISRLARDCEQVAVNAPAISGAAAQAQALGIRLISDAPCDPDGPLAGIKAGLEWAAGEGAGHLAVIPCDAPLLPDDLIPTLLHGLDDAAAVVAQTDQGVEPLCAIWAVSALSAVREALAAGDHPPVHVLLDQLRARRVRFDHHTAFLNVNTPDDLAAAEDR